MSDDKKKISRGSFLGNFARMAGALVLGEQLPAKSWAAPAVTPAKDAVAMPVPPPKNPLPFALIEECRFETSIQKLAGITLDSKDRIFTAGEKGIKVFDMAGKALQEIVTPAPATCVTVGADGSIYVGHRGLLEKYNAEGTKQWSWGAGSTPKPGKAQENKPDEAPKAEAGQVYYTSLALDGEFLYAADAGSRSLKRFTIDGDFVDEISGFEIPSPFFQCAADGKGTIFVANTGKHRIESYDRNGKMLSHWGKFGMEPQNFCGCCNPTSFATFPDGKIVTTEKGIPRLKVYDPEHRLIAMIAKEAFPEGVAGMCVAINSQQRIILSEPKKGEIRVYGLGEGKG